MNSVMMRLALHLSVIALMLLAQVPAAAQSSGFVWRRDTLPPLRSSTIYIVQGTAQNGGCTFRDVDHAPPDAAAWVVRQLALDFQRCLAITEEGFPGADFRSPTADGYERAPDSRALGRRAAFGGGSMGKFARPLAYSNTGYTEYWYNDGWGNLQSKTHTDISWSFDGSCVSSISVSGYYQWNSSNFSTPTGQSSSADVDGGQPCTPGNSVGNGRIYGNFPGPGGCYHYYDPALAQGNQSGGINYGPYAVNSNCSAWYSYFNKFKYAGVVG
jgi:hypothetical protein